MKEKIEVRINRDYSDLLFEPHEGIDVGTSVKVVELYRDDARFCQIPVVDSTVQKKHNSKFFFGWKIIRKYSKKEIDNATLFYVKFRKVFEPAGEECGTIYDESTACELCGANRTQVGALKLAKGSIPSMDFSRTIAGEVVVSENMLSVFRKRGLLGAEFKAVTVENSTSTFFQLTAKTEIGLSTKTIAGINPFDLSISDGQEIYKCPKGHTIGLNLLSEPYVTDRGSNLEIDLLSSKQKVGVKRGLLRPEPLFFCSQRFRLMVIEERLTGLDFEIAHQG